jgi:hypothetical protein
MDDKNCGIKKERKFLEVDQHGHSIIQANQTRTTFTYAGMKHEIEDSDTPAPQTSTCMY